LRQSVTVQSLTPTFSFPGIASVASFTLATTSAAGKEVGVPVFGSIFQIGWAFAIGIAFAIITCAPVSGGHFNPAITLCFAIWQGFPWRKVPHYIFSQIFGAFIAGLLLMGCYWPEIQAAKALDLKTYGTTAFNGGVASILCTFPNSDQTNQGYIFFQEFFVDSFIGIVIWACLDPANPFVTPVSVPFTIGIAYAAMVWGFAGNSISTNLARDLGTRMVAAIFFGSDAFPTYSWISILVNIPATIFATSYYELLMRDSLQKISKGHAEHEDGEEGLARHLTNVGAAPQGAMNSTWMEQSGARNGMASNDEKF
jgi:glycerol uptake facilitator-like aquaporin